MAHVVQGTAEEEEAFEKATEKKLKDAGIGGMADIEAQVKKHRAQSDQSLQRQSVIATLQTEIDQLKAHRKEHKQEFDTAFGEIGSLIKARNLDPEDGGSGLWSTHTPRRARAPRTTSALVGSAAWASR